MAITTCKGFQQNRCSVLTMLRSSVGRAGGGGGQTIFPARILLRGHGYSVGRAWVMQVFPAGDSDKRAWIHDRNDGEAAHAKREHHKRWCVSLRETNVLGLAAPKGNCTVRNGEVS